MPEYFLGQIIATSFGFAPKGFALCNGQLLSVQTNSALFSLLGIRYGGDGVRTFGLPDLRGRTPIGSGVSADAAWQPGDVALGASGGAETVVLSAEHMPSHTHALKATESTANPVRNPGSGVLSAGGANKLYRGESNNSIKLAPGSVAPGATAAGHENMQPFVVLSYCICTSGVFPSRT